MADTEQNIPLAIVRLLVGNFTSTNTQSEKVALDEWICASDENMKVFEQCLETSLRSANPDQDNDELAFFVNLFIKDIKKIINPFEKELLDGWINESAFNKNLFNEIPVTDDREFLYQWLEERLQKEQNRMRLN